MGEAVVLDKPHVSVAVPAIASLQWQLSQDLLKRIRGSVEAYPEAVGGGRLLRCVKEEECLEGSLKETDIPRSTGKQKSGGAFEATEQDENAGRVYDSQLPMAQAPQEKSLRPVQGELEERSKFRSLDQGLISKATSVKKNLDHQRSCNKLPSHGPSFSSATTGADTSLLPAQHTSLLNRSLRKHYLTFQEVKAKMKGEDLNLPMPSFLHSCLNKQKDTSLAEIDFVVELSQGHSFHGPPYVEEYGKPSPTVCKTCGCESSFRLLRNSAEDEKCLFSRTSFQGVLSSKCDACLENFRAAQAAAVQDLKNREGFLSDEEKAHAVVLRLRERDFSAHMQAYRLYHWMKSRGVQLRIKTLQEPSPHFILQNPGELKKLVKELEKERKGELIESSASVCIPHFAHPLDESLSTMNGRRTFMQTCEAQPFANVHGLSHTRHACLKERKEQIITSVSEESLISCYRPA